MTTIATALETAFTPSGTSFIAQVTNGSAYLERRNTSGAAWAEVRGSSIQNEAVLVDNPVAGADYRFRASGGSPTVQADE